MPLQTNPEPEDDLFSRRTEAEVVEKDIWRLLLQAVDDRSCGWRLPVIGSRSSAGVRQRTMVLRAVDEARRSMLVHTDARSPKVAQFEADDRVSMLFYDPSRAIQLCVTATATVHTNDDIAEQLWNSSHPLSLKYCLGPHAPGHVTPAPNFNLPEEWIDREPTREDLATARQQFAVIEFSVRRIDWLSLSRDGNLRAAFEYTVDHPDVVSRQWLAP